jgi:hypothetical protein
LNGPKYDSGCGVSFDVGVEKEDEETSTTTLERRDNEEGKDESEDEGE